VDQIIKVYLAGGHEITLTHEESKQFLQHLQNNMHPSSPAP
jgi:hypothetical protein